DQAVAPREVSQVRWVAPGFLVRPGARATARHQPTIPPCGKDSSSNIRVAPQSSPAPQREPFPRRPGKFANDSVELMGIEPTASRVRFHGVSRKLRLLTVEGK